MSGHSKWANIKHKKAASDAVKGRIFSKIAKEIMVAARSGGDPTANITLRALVQKARSVNMPMDNITRAIKKGSGELEGAAMEEIIYEGYAPGGVALVVQSLSDNKNRTASEVRNVFNKNGGNLAGAGAVMRSFHRRGTAQNPGAVGQLAVEPAGHACRLFGASGCQHACHVVDGVVGVLGFGVTPQYQVHLISLCDGMP